MLTLRSGRMGVLMYYNEMYDGTNVREAYASLFEWVAQMPAEIRQMKQAEAEALFRRIGITFAG